MQISVKAVTYMFLDIAPDLLAEGKVLGHGTVEDRVIGLDVRRYSYREGKQGI